MRYFSYTILLAIILSLYPTTNSLAQDKNAIFATYGTYGFGCTYTMNYERLLNTNSEEGAKKLAILGQVGFGGSIHSGLFGPTSKYRVYKIGINLLPGAKTKHIEVGLGAVYEQLLISQGGGWLGGPIKTKDRVLPRFSIGYRYQNENLVLRLGGSIEGLYISLGASF